MKVRDIANKFSINEYDFEQFIKSQNLQHTVGMMSLSVNDSNVEEYVRKFRIYEAEQRERKRLLALEAEERERNKLSAEDIARIKAEEEQQKKIEKARLRKATAGMLITSGFTFDGYRITKYSGYISGDDAMSVERGVGSVLFSTVNAREELLKSLSQIRRNALQELKEAAYNLGCNAVIGVDFDYITLDPQTASITGGTVYQPYVFCVTANGNAVVIEKIED